MSTSGGCGGGDGEVLLLVPMQKSKLMGGKTKVEWEGSCNGDDSFVQSYCGDNDDANETIELRVRVTRFPYSESQGLGNGMI